MVSLYNIVMLQRHFSHLSTGIPSLDKVLLSPQSRILDFQSGPGCFAAYTVSVSLLISHLVANESNTVIVIDTLNPFPWNLITNHPQFQPKWLDENIISYTVNTFAKLFALFTYNILPKDKAGGSTMLLINDYHEMVELYKFELSAVYEETILKHHIERNAIIISNQEQFELVGTKTALPELPANSDLLRVSPVAKFESHVYSLLILISSFVINNNLFCILLGHLDTKYETYWPKSTQSNSSQSTSSGSFGKVVLTDALGGKYEPPKSTSTNISGKVMKSKSSLDSFVTSRLVFFKDWYHKSPHFKKNFPPITPSSRVALNNSNLRMVFVVQVKHLQQMVSTRYPPIYFDHDNEYYHLDDSDVQLSKNPSQFLFIDLSGTESASKNPSPTGMTRNGTVIDGDEPFDKESTAIIEATEKPIIDMPPSSPNQSENHVCEMISSTNPGVNELNIPIEDDLVVEESEDEIIGTLLGVEKES